MLPAYAGKAAAAVWAGGRGNNPLNTAIAPPRRLLFPLDSLAEGLPLLVEVWDKDFGGAQFLGQVLMTLGKALEIAEDAAAGRAYWCARSSGVAGWSKLRPSAGGVPTGWACFPPLGSTAAADGGRCIAAPTPDRFPLAKKRSADAVAGELCLGFEVLDAISFAEVRGSEPLSWVCASRGERRAEQLGMAARLANNTSIPAWGPSAPWQAVAEVEAESDPALLAPSLARCALHLQLHGLSGLVANGLVLGSAPAATAAGHAAEPQQVAAAAAAGSPAQSPRPGNGPSGGGAGKVGGRAVAAPRARTLLICYGRFCLERPMPNRWADGTLSHHQGLHSHEPPASRTTRDAAAAYGPRPRCPWPHSAPRIEAQQEHQQASPGAGAGPELCINEEVIIPLEPALRAAALAGRRKEEVRGALPQPSGPDPPRPAQYPSTRTAGRRLCKRHHHTTAPPCLCLARTAARHQDHHQGRRVADDRQDPDPHYQRAHGAALLGRRHHQLALQQQRRRRQRQRQRIGRFEARGSRPLGLPAGWRQHWRRHPRPWRGL
jgi:hypothetical protein